MGQLYQGSVISEPVVSNDSHQAPIVVQPIPRKRSTYRRRLWRRSAIVRVASGCGLQGDQELGIFAVLAITSREGPSPSQILRASCGRALSVIPVRHFHG